MSTAAHWRPAGRELGTHFALPRERQDTRQVRGRFVSVASGASFQLPSTPCSFRRPRKGGVVAVLITQRLESLTTAQRQGHCRRLRELLQKKLMKAQLSALHISTATVHFQAEGLLQRSHPIQQQLKLNLRQSPLMGGRFGSDEVCQWSLASRSR